MTTLVMLGQSFLKTKLKLHHNSRSLLSLHKTNLMPRSRRFEVTTVPNSRTSPLMSICDKKGIKHEFSAPYNPQQNGVVERKNRTLITLARAMLDEYGTPEKFWAEAINTACYTSNRIYLHKLLDKTPYELLVGRKPNVSYFRVFGCKVYIFKKRERLGKFQRRTDEGILVGYAGNAKAYRVYNSSTGIVEVSCNVEFDE